MSKILIQKVSSLLQKAYQGEVNLIESLSEGEQSAEGTFENWSPKDSLAHTTYWRQRMVETLAYAFRDQAPPTYPPYDQVNRDVYFEKQHTPLPALLREAESTMNAVKDALNRFEDEDLIDPNRYEWRKGTPLLPYVLGNGYIHIIHHLVHTWRKLNDLSRAHSLQEEALQLTSSLTELGTSRALLLYDMACLLTSGSEYDRALDLLEEALQLDPHLIEWCQQDPDLEPLHNEPRFQKLTRH
ncbi:MAG: ClbS/DfsB family four-helix bundle protein [Chloroflexota bacterium]